MPCNNCKCNKNDTSKVTRVEIIDKVGGRQFVDSNVEDIELSLQDEGKTLKVFVNYTGLTEYMGG